jgi:UDP-N-acetyl-D-glucosamine dehydrogenase
MNILKDKIASGNARLAVIGMGYVGLPLAIEFARGGIDTTGVDVTPEKVSQINAGCSYIGDVPDDDVARFVETGTLRATSDFSILAECDCIIICVPTPLGKTKDPDISYIVAACDEIAKYAHKDMLVVLESTTYPGSTEELILPRLKVNGAEAGQDFFLAFSPERVDPGNKTWTVRNTPKVIGGMTPACIETASALYRYAIDQIVSVSSPAAAEMVKLLENTFRAVNIGLVNEISLICDRLGLNVWEIIDAAATKPFGFTAFQPGPGLGGHCLPIDPLYLSWKMRGMDYETRFIDLADKINANMPYHWVEKVQDALNDEGKAVRAAKVLILGVAYKANVGDVRESPALYIIRGLLRKGAEVVYNDPYVPTLSIPESGVELSSLALSDTELRDVDCTVVVTAHDDYDWDDIAANCRLVIDTRNAMKNVKSLPSGEPQQDV